MAQLPMYAAVVNSPSTELAADITATDTEITVLDASKLPPAPNLVTVGGDETAETILYTGKTGNTLTGCTRGFEGTAKGWAAGSPAARNHTAYDYEAGRANIADLDERVENTVIPDASLTEKGIVQLSDATDGTRSTVAATEKAVNDARQSLTDELTEHEESNVSSNEPHGLRIQSGRLQYFDGANWADVKSDMDVSTSNVTLYVNATTGVDTPERGLTSGTPVKTINYALSLIPKVLRHTYTISISAGTYDEDVLVTGFINAGGSILIGNLYQSNTGRNVRNIRLVNCDIQVQVSGLKATYTGGFGVVMNGCRRVVLNNFECDSIATGYAGIYVASSNLETYNSVVSNRYAGIQATQLAVVLSNTTTGSGNTFGLRAEVGATIIKAGTQPGGTTAESAQSGGLIR